MKPVFTIRRPAVHLDWAVAAFLLGVLHPIEGSAAPPPNRQPVFKIEEGYVDAGPVLIYYKVFGSGPALLILHGGPGASHDWRP
jgi:hypothetical protein